MHSGSLRSMEEECFETKVKNRMRSGGSEFGISWMSEGGGTDEITYSGSFRYLACFCESLLMLLIIPTS
jgi:hypothetical protein